MITLPILLLPAGALPAEIAIKLDDGAPPRELITSTTLHCCSFPQIETASMISAPPLWLVATLLSIGSATLGQILLKMGVRAASLPADALCHPLALLGALVNPYVLCGILAFATSMILWLAALSGQQLSSVYPMAALGYVAVTVLSVRVFSDSMTTPKIAGIVLIVLGVAVLNSGTFLRSSHIAQMQAQSGP